MAAASTKAERSAAREKYCTEKLVPVLQEMVMQMLKVLPDDPEDYMRSWLDEQIMKEGAPADFEPAPMVFAAPPPMPEPEPLGAELEIEGEIVPEEEATRLSTLTQLIADTPGASRATWVSVRGSVVPYAEKEAVERLSLQPVAEIADAAPQPKLSTLSQLIADTPGAARTTVVTVRGTVVPEADAKKIVDLV
jgi:sulfur carrier protein ThiS